MALSFQYGDTGFNANSDGVFIPVANLTGVTAQELASGQSAISKEGKALFGLLNRLYTVVNPSSFAKLGFSVARNNPSPVNVDVLNDVFSISFQYLVNALLESVTVVPVPTSGANSGVGDISMLDVFPGATKVASGAATGGAGILIPSSDVSAYAPNLSHAGLTLANDCRNYLSALLVYAADNVTVRATGITSAVTSAVLGAYGTLTIPASYYAATDPTADVDSADLPNLALLSRTIQFTVQTVRDQATQTFDINVA